MPAPSSLTLNYDGLLSSTLFNYRKKFEDNISTANAFFHKIKKNGGYKTLGSIGERMAMPLMYELGSADSYSGYDQLDVTPMEGFTTAFFEWRQASIPISISGREERINKGEEQIVNLLEGKVKQAELGIQEFFNKKLLQGNGGTSITTPYTSSRNGSVFVDPLALQVAYDPTAALSPGNISQLTYTWWRNQFKNSGATTYAAWKKELIQLRNNCSKGPGGVPDLYLSDQHTYELYNAALAAAHQNPSYQSADIPFENVAFFGKPWTWDEFVPDAANGSVTQSTSSGTLYMLNTKFWGVKVDASCNFSTGPFVKPENQDAKTAQILWMGGVGVSNRRKQGVMGSIDTTITS